MEIAGKVLNGEVKGMAGLFAEAQRGVQEIFEKQGTELPAPEETKALEDGNSRT
jgi:hypothetical protein